MLRRSMFCALTRSSILHAGAAVLISVLTLSTSLASDTVYEPSASDPRIVAALAARQRLVKVMRAADIAGVEALTAPDIVVNAPINKVVNRDNIIARLKAHQISYEPEVVETIDFVGVRGDMVVIMGLEVVHPNKDAPYAGKTEYRRSTEVWKPFDGVWKLWIRQATITKIE
jgi:ketosteroid isomerase-like protein